MCWSSTDPCPHRGSSTQTEKKHNAMYLPILNDYAFQETEKSQRGSGSILRMAGLCLGRNTRRIVIDDPAVSSTDHLSSNSQTRLH